jgi:cytosine/adenosine deaminase-related metal-dependent hydrolase
LKLNLASGREPVVIHIGEGTDQGAHTEIDELLKWNLFEKKLIGIHAIAMNERQASKFHAVVWCPDSNYFLIGHTAAVETLARNTRIVFGTDSTVSARWSIWEHLRHAQREKKLSDLELFNSVTVNPAQVWKLKNQGQIAEKYTADFVVAKGKSTLPMEAFFSVTPEDILLVVHKGKVVLFDERLHGSFDESSLYQKIKYPSSVKFVKGKLGDLVKQIKSYYPGAGFPFAV